MYSYINQAEQCSTQSTVIEKASISVPVIPAWPGHYSHQFLELVAVKPSYRFRLTTALY